MPHLVFLVPKDANMDQAGPEETAPLPHVTATLVQSQKCRKIANSEIIVVPRGR